MPIQNLPLTNISLQQVKKSIDNISRNAWKLTNVGGTEGVAYTNNIPGTADLDEGAAVFYYDGAATYRIYFKINNTIKYVSLT